jgi:hypothetical protein
MSGGPVLSLTSGAVVAVTRSSRDTADAKGGSAIPVRLACEAYEDVRQFEGDAPVAARPWRDTIGRLNWLSIGQRFEMETDVELHLSGTGEEWCSTLNVVSEGGETRTASDFNEGLTAAMFKWAQRQRLSSPEDVELLCRLLSQALFPAAVERHLVALSQADTVSVRLVVDPPNGLEDIPWELAAIPNSPAPITGDDRFRFFRIDARAAPRVAHRPAARLRVLGVLGLADYPEAIRSRSRQWQWPDHGRFKTDFSNNFDPEVTDWQFKDSCELADLDAGGEQFDVVHYVGAGMVGHGGRGWFSMVEDAQEGFLKFHGIDILFERAEEARAKVVVLEVTEPPLLPAVDSPLTPSSLGNIFTGHLEAVVLTRFPLHPSQLRPFNRGFYSALEAGATISDAVQAGRRLLKRASGSQDAPDYSSYTLITRAGPQLQLVQGQAAPDPASSRLSDSGASASAERGWSRREPRSSGFGRG